MLFIIFVLLINDIFAIKECTNNIYKQCEDRLFKSYNLTLEDLIPDVPTWDENFSNINLRCRGVNIYLGCMNDFVKNCSTDIQDKTNSIEYVYNKMLCFADENKKEFVEFRPCYVKIIQEITGCSNNLNDSLQSVQFDNKGKIKSTDLDLFCRAYYNHHKCLIQLVRNSDPPCYENASIWLDAWYRNLKGPYLISKGCSAIDWLPNIYPVESTDGDMSVIIGIIIAITALILIIIALIFIIYLYTKRKNLLHSNGIRRHRESAQDAPPPYAMLAIGGAENELHLVDSESQQPTVLFNGAIPQNGVILPPSYENLATTINDIHKVEDSDILSRENEIKELNSGVELNLETNTEEIQNESTIDGFV